MIEALSKPPILPRRGWLVATAAWLAAPAPWAAAPAVNLALQWRLVPWPPAPMPVATPGTVTVGTAGAAGAGMPPPGTRTTRTAAAPDAGPQRLVLRNGGQAQVVLRRDDRNDPPDWVWTPQGQGIQSAGQRPARRESLWVQVQWPGGRAPATLTYRFEQPWPDPGRADAAQQMDGELLLPLDQWAELGHWAAPDGSGQALEVRLSRLP